MCVQFTSEKPIILRKPRIVWKRLRTLATKGEYMSRLGVAGSQQAGYPRGKTLTYTRGQITVAVEGSPGIYVYTSKPVAGVRRIGAVERNVVRMEVPAGAWFRRAKFGQATVQCVRTMEAL